MLRERLRRRQGEFRRGLPVFGPETLAVAVLQRVLVVVGGLGCLGRQVVHILSCVERGVVAVALCRLTPAVVVIGPTALVVSLGRFDKLSAFASLEIRWVVVVRNDL